MMYVYAFKNEIHYFVDIYTNFFLGPSLPQMIKQPNPKKHKKHDLVKWYDLWLNQQISDNFTIMNRDHAYNAWMLTSLNRYGSCNQ